MKQKYVRLFIKTAVSTLFASEMGRLAIGAAYQDRGYFDIGSEYLMPFLAFFVAYKSMCFVGRQMEVLSREYRKIKRRRIARSEHH